MHLRQRKSSHIKKYEAALLMAFTVAPTYREYIESDASVDYLSAPIFQRIDFHLNFFYKYTVIKNRPKSVRKKFLETTIFYHNKYQICPLLHLK